MEKLIFNIDSNDRNKTTYPNSHNFTYNRVEESVDSIYKIESFVEKNVIEMNVSSVEIPNNFYYINSTKGNNKITVDGVEYTISDGSYTKSELLTELDNVTHVHIPTYSSTTGKVTFDTDSKDFSFTSLSSYPSLGEILGYKNDVTYNDGDTAPNAMTLPQEPYVFLKINDLGNIIHKNKNYVAKLVPDNSSRYNNVNTETVYRTLSTRIVFDQPIDINKLDISLVDSAGNLCSINNTNFSFNLELVKIKNSLLKEYEQNNFYSVEVANRLLNSKMLKYYENKNNTLMQEYSKVSNNSFNSLEFNYDGNRQNYDYNNFFKN